MYRVNVRRYLAGCRERACIRCSRRCRCDARADASGAENELRWQSRSLLLFILVFAVTIFAFLAATFVVDSQRRETRAAAAFPL